MPGTLACGTGHGCEIVQFSPWGWFLGVDVALIGTVGYTLILVTALIGTTAPRWIRDPLTTLRSPS